MTKSVARASAAGVLLLGGISCLGLNNALKKMEAAYDEVEKSTIVKSRLEDLQATCVDAETGQRGYLITGRERYLIPYADAQSRVRGQMSELLLLAPYRSDELHAVYKEIEEKFDELATTISLVKDGQKPKAYTEVDSDRGKRSMERIRTAMKTLTNREDQLLQERRAEARRATASAVSTSMSLTILGAVLGSIGIAAAGLLGRNAARED